MRKTICYSPLSPLFILLCTLLAVSPAYAEKKDSVVLDTVTVTAQKIEENPQDVPISMDVITGSEIEDAGITDMTELIQFSPNLFSTPSLDNRAIIVRGVSTHNSILSPSVGIFVDGVSLPTNRMQDQDLLDIEQIEILRGPQGTLYGKNTESGAINITTRQPGNELLGKISTDIGFYDTPRGAVPLFRGWATVSGPLVTDTLYAGLAVQLKNSDGYMKNLYDNDERAGHIDRKSGRFNLRWTPTTSWDLSFIADMSDYDDGYGYPRYADGAGQTNPYEINWNGGNDWEDNSNSQTVKAKYSGENFDFLSISGRNYNKNSIFNDADFGPFDFQYQDWVFETTSWTQEFRFTSPTDASNFKWVAGLFGSRDETYVKAHTPAYFIIRDTDITSNTLAAFGQGTYTLFDRLHLTAGLRYEHQEMEGEQTNLYEAIPEYSRSDSDDEFLPKFSISYDVTDTIMVYATYAQGFLSGGYNFYMCRNADEMHYKPEHTTNYEIGAKTSFLDNRLIINAALFHLDIKDKQVIEWPVGEPVTARRIANAAKASSDGFELEIKARPLPGLDVFTNFGYTEAKFEDWTTSLAAGGSYDYKGNYLANAPLYTYNAGFQYRIQNGLFFRSDVLGVGSYYSGNENTSKVNGYTTVNCRVGYEQEDYDIILWANNIFGERYYTSDAYYFGSLVQDGPPMSAGVTLTYRF